MGDLLKMFDGIVCICMDKEENKWQGHCIPQFKSLGCADRVIRYKSLKIPDGSELRKKYKGTTFAHYNAIKLCQEKNFKNPLILESDFWFAGFSLTSDSTEALSASSEFISKSFESVQTKKWKIFSLGGLIKKLYSIENDYLFRVSRQQSHAYCVNSDHYDYILNYFTLKERNLRQPVDWLYTQKRFGGDICDYSYMTSKLLVHQCWSKTEKRRKKLADGEYRKQIKKKNFKPKL